MLPETSPTSEHFQQFPELWALEQTIKNIKLSFDLFYKKFFQKMVNKHVHKW